jgi:predicted O-linked N-acetylglucosamine transferase (SPINDLY family)
MWMGVPVVSLMGRTGCGRAGLSLISAAGLPELVARRPEDFATIAAALAGDRDRLEFLRRNLRQMMTNSPLMDGRGFARRVESAFGDIWRKWCAG